MAKEPFGVSVFLFAVMISLSLRPCVTARQGVVTAAQVNGTWRRGLNEFKILLLGNNRLKIPFFGTHATGARGDPMANTGDASGIAIITGETATFLPTEDAARCKITLTFRMGQMRVTEAGDDCGFGAGVTSGGSYRRVSRRTPQFDRE